MVAWIGSVMRPGCSGVMCALCACLLQGCSRGGSEALVIYTSQDQVYAERILNGFSRETGISVRAVFDSESAKTMGLLRRLVAERDRPNCDVFWSNEGMAVHLLSKEGVLSSGQGWRTFGARSRVLVANPRFVSADRAPRSLLELTNETWRGRVAFAYPLFGTTATHWLALKALWGSEAWEAWCEGLVRNGAKVVDGNSMVVRMVGAGEAWLGLTDSDDFAVGRKNGLTVVELEQMEQEMCWIPNTAGVIFGAPHPESAQRLVDYLSRPDVLQGLLEVSALRYLQWDEGKGLPVPWQEVTMGLEASQTFLKRTFLR